MAEANYRAAQQDLLVRVAQAVTSTCSRPKTRSTPPRRRCRPFSRQLEQAEKRFEVGLIAITDVQESRAAHDSATAG